MTWRYEIKFLDSAAEEFRIFDWLANAAFFYRSFPSRQINSVYFDSRDFDCARTNLDGTGWRSKFRIRWYGDYSSTGNKKFEAKVKRGRLGTKYTENIDFEMGNYSNVDAGIIEDAINKVEILANDPVIAINIIPILYVGYKREYYQGPNGIRVTLDRGMQFQDLTRIQSGQTPSFETDDRLVIEFKFPPQIKDQVSETMMTFPFAASRSSKYLIGLSRIGHAQYI